MPIIHLIHLNPNLQLEKIHRCWIVWDCSICVVIVPSFLAFAFLGPSIYLHSLIDFNLWFLVIWITGFTAPSIIVQDQRFILNWGNTLAATGLALSMTVNALVTGLIVFKIFKVFQAVKTSVADGQISGVTASDGSPLRRVIFILIESGIALFSIQLARLVVIMVGTNAALKAEGLIGPIHEMLNVVIRSVIVTLSYS